MLPSVLAQQLEQGLRDYIETTFPVSTPRFRDTFRDLINRPQALFKGPYISVKLPFRHSENGSHLLRPLTLPQTPYLHQQRAFERLTHNCRSTVISTGTGSGKTECFLYPILRHCVQHPGPGIKAIIIYPMNALASDQAERIAKAVYQDEALKSKITAGLYIGQYDEHPSAEMTRDRIITDKQTMNEHPPDILLTNYKMLDLLLIRSENYGLWARNDPETLKYMVVDELHTFDGAQGTDLACLIRRLKQRLGTPGGHLCAVGTSATLGGRENTADLIDYAQTVFGEPFEPDAVISESLLTPREFCDTGSDMNYHLPDPELLNQLDITQSAADYQQSLIKAWFGDQLDINNKGWQHELGLLLKQHALLRAVLTVLNGTSRSMTAISDELDRTFPEFRNYAPEHKSNLIYSFLALISLARSRRNGKTIAFLQVRLQLWQRELRRMVGSVENKPVIRFSDDLKPQEQEQHLPIIHCRECGAMGWGGSKQRQDEHVDPDRRTFYINFFNHHINTIFIFPLEESDENDHICGHCLHLMQNQRLKSCPACGQDGRLIPVHATHNLRTGEQNHSSHDCPYCGGTESLTIVGMRAASMISVSIGQLFSSRFNDDKKLLAFSDSVQDASHKAGFFSARTFRFNFRSAVQQYINQTHQPVRLSDLPRNVIEHYQHIWDQEKYIATFIAPDMTWMNEFNDLLENDDLEADTKLIQDINRRIEWEVLSEYGFNCRIGRTLEKTGSSVASPDKSMIQSVTDNLLDPLRNEFGPLRELREPDLKLFLYGILAQLKTRGAFEFDLLHSYKTRFGDSYVLNRNPVMPNFGTYSRLPRFLTTRAGYRFDTLASGPRQGNTWYQQWVIKCFQSYDMTINSVMNDILSLTVQTLEVSGILKRETERGHPVWSLLPEVFWVHPQVIQLRCDTCGHQHSIAEHEYGIWKNAACLRYNCRGHYKIQKHGDNYYRRFYASGDITRLFIKEHTGLLGRTEREKLEKRFKGDSGEKKPWTPNALSCTPTLEMGIDIGDLSSLILCSVPPNASNYLQRIGRSGRRDGNSLNITVANGRAHDLYFYHEPDSMINGPVTPPGCYLNAPAVLERQLIAFTFDCWMHETGGAAQVPKQIKRVLNNLQKGDPLLFPQNWLQFVHKNKETLLSGFLGLFPDINKETKEHLRQYFFGSDARKDALTRFHYELSELQNEVQVHREKIRQINRTIKKMQNNPAKDQNYENDLAELELEKSALTDIVKNIRNNKTYNYLTDQGILPNYTFPEIGIILRSIIYRKQKTGKTQTLTFEYERPAVSAIQELAPCNHFYAQGRKVNIEQVDIRLSKFEEWRFCPNCPHMERTEHGDDKTTCPVCGSVNWSDEGQKRTMLRMRQVYARTSDRDSRSRDESDVRQPQFYYKHMLVNTERQYIQKAYQLDNDQVPFGFEYLSRADFREINFGVRSDQSEKVDIAGQQFPRQGFSLCRECGYVQTSNTPKHDRTCSYRNKPDARAMIRSSYLYREFSSEAIRILLPMTSFSDSSIKLHSFIAAFLLGLQEKFHGSIDHLSTATQDEPMPGNGIRKKYLILYDTVPGGTGYLKELLRAQTPLMEVFEKALAAMTSCSCNQIEGKDGCYGCVYQYRNSYDMPNISRDTAVDMFSSIVNRKSTLTPVDDIGDISMNPVLESELEARFIERLQQTRIHGAPVKVEDRVVRGKPGWRFYIQDNIYDMAPQIELKAGEQSPVPVSIDFVIDPVQSDLDRPVAVFTDGYAYHADPDKGMQRVGYDMLQRMGLVRTGAFYACSLTWDDVIHMSSDLPYDNYLDCNHSAWNTLLEHNFESDELKIFNRLFRLDSFELLIRFLTYPRADAWRRFAMTHAITHIKQNTSASVIESLRNQLMDSDDTDALNALLETESGTADYSWGVYAREHSGKPAMQMLVHAENNRVRQFDSSAICVSCRLYDDTLPGDVLKPVWNGFLRLYNVYQFLPNAFFVASSFLETDMSEPPALTSEPVIQQQETEDWSVVDAQYHPVLDHIKQHNLPMPEFGYELFDGQTVIGQAELAWPRLKLAFLHELDKAYQSGFESRGWRTRMLSDIVNDLSICDTLLQSNQEESS